MPKVKGKTNRRTVEATYLQESLSFRHRTIAKQTAASTRTTVPPALRTTSVISSCGPSQKSTVANRGPDRYHASHKRKRSLIGRAFTAAKISYKVPRQHTIVSQCSRKDLMSLSKRSRLRKI